MGIENESVGTEKQREYARPKQSRTFQMVCDEEFLEALMKVARHNRTTKSEAARLAVFKQAQAISST